MPSTTSHDASDGLLGWREAGLSYFSLGHFFHWKLGGRVWKLSIDAGCNCPNVDGTVATGGCIFCNVRSFSPSRRAIVGSVTEQIDEGVRRLGRRCRVERFIAYFQPATNTHGPIELLRKKWIEAISHGRIVGLIIGTRPDCVPDEVLDALEELSRRTWLSVEYGLQSIHDRSLDWLNRGHRYDAFLDAVARSRARGLRVGVHVILGLPGESRDDMQATARELSRLRIDSVKVHNLLVVRDTRLADDLASGTLALPNREEYVGFVVDFLERLHPECVVDRLSGDAPREFLIAPTWCLNKEAVRKAVLEEFKRRGTCQGQYWEQAE